MTYDVGKPSIACPICGWVCNVLVEDFGTPIVVDCDACGDWESAKINIDDWRSATFGDPNHLSSNAALASHLIRRMQVDGKRAKVTREFFSMLHTRQLPTPQEALDNLLQALVESNRDRIGVHLEIAHDNPAVISTAGVVRGEDVAWLMQAMQVSQWWAGIRGLGLDSGQLTIAGYQQYEKLRLAQIASRYAFFARQFRNQDLDKVYAECLRPAVLATGYELRVASQKAGHIDAIIEDEIRRCKFLLADLSDDNGGAYWEAGFAEGLGKPVIYICKEKDGASIKKTHFDTEHRHTVRWDLATLDQTATHLKAVIRNTLLGDAMQDDP